jgi:hypothetical protein
MEFINFTPNFISSCQVLGGIATRKTTASRGEIGGSWILAFRVLEDFGFQSGFFFSFWRP